MGAKFSPGGSSLLNAYILVFGNNKPNKQTKHKHNENPVGIS